MVVGYKAKDGGTLDDTLAPLQHLESSMSPSGRKESYVDVLIIGAGPSGLFCANGLAKAGINVRIIDKRCVVPTLGPNNA